MSQFHFDPATYLDLMRDEVPSYDAPAGGGGRGHGRAGGGRAAARPRAPGRARRSPPCWRSHPGARRRRRRQECGHARRRPEAVWPGSPSSCGWPSSPTRCPPGPSTSSSRPWPSTTSRAADKAVALRPHGRRAAPGGRFVLGDVVVPVDPADAVTPVTSDHDRPSTMAEQLGWLAEAGLDAAPWCWDERDLVVLRRRSRQGHRSAPEAGAGLYRGGIMTPPAEALPPDQSPGRGAAAPRSSA